MKIYLGKNIEKCTVRKYVNVEKYPTQDMYP